MSPTLERGTYSELERLKEELQKRAVTEVLPQKVENQKKAVLMGAKLDGA